MAKSWNLGELRDQLSYILDFNEGVADQSFAGPSTNTSKHLNRAINEGYANIVNKVSNECSKKWLVYQWAFTWPALRDTYSLPEAIQDNQIVTIVDVTDTNIGQTLSVGERSGGAILWWKDRNTLHWQDEGPRSARDIEIEFYAAPSEMTDDEHSPYLVPAQFRHLIYWEAAIILRDIADEAAPASWVRRRNEIRDELVIWASQGRPTETGKPVIINRSPDYYGAAP